MSRFHKNRIRARHGSTMAGIRPILANDLLY
jgi:hypothetical protein